MSSTLNLDELASEKRVVTLKGVSYEMKEMSVSDFIELTRISENLSDDMPPSEQMELMVRMIQMSFPEMPKEVLHGLNIRQLNKITEFAQTTKFEDEEGN